jgi:hypothetical protein
MMLWSLTKKKKMLDFKLNPGGCFDLQLSPDGHVLGLASDRPCLFWDFQQLCGASAK